MEEEIRSPRTEPPPAKRHKREEGFHDNGDDDDEDLAAAATVAPSDCYRYRSGGSSRSPNNDVGDGHDNPVEESWLTNVEPFVMAEEKDEEDDNNSMTEDDDPMMATVRKNRRHQQPDQLQQLLQLQQLRRQLIQTKRRLEPYSDRQFRQARRYCNPYEALDDSINLFLNRSALKLANVDALLHFRLSRRCCILPPAAHYGGSSTAPPLPRPYFVDLCGAPGGFGEYLVWRGAMRGYGMSLVGRNENGRGLQWNRALVRLQQQGPQQRNSPHQSQSQQQHHQDPCFAYEIHNGVDGTGDVYNWENVLSLQRHIAARQEQRQRRNNRPPHRDHDDDDHDDNNNNNDDDDDSDDTDSTTHVGAQLVLADGGVDAQRNVADQEKVTIKLLVCQIAAALYLLRPGGGGTILFKAFGFQSVVVRAVMHYLCHRFDAVHVLKPITSRPASAERYVVAEGYHGSGSDRADGDDNGEFNGPRWISRMLLASPADVAPQVAAFLDAKDEAMLTLNLKACGDILRRLHQMKTQASDHEIMEEDDDDDESSLPIFSFKTKWQLF